MARIKVQRIEITRAEGPVPLCGKTETAISWAGANDILRRWSATAPISGGYDKCDFVVVFMNGTRYAGRYDLKHYSCERPDLSRHVRSVLRFSAGIRCPNGMTPERYEEAVNAFPDIKERCQRLLAGYLFQDWDDEEPCAKCGLLIRVADRDPVDDAVFCACGPSDRNPEEA